MLVQIVGVRKSESKGKNAFNYFGLKSFTDYEQENSDCNGHAVVSEFSYTDFNIVPGDVVEFDYEPGFQGRATLVNVRKIKSVLDLDDKNEDKSASDPKDKKETK